MADGPAHARHQKAHFWQRVVKDFRRNKDIYLMLLPVLIYYVIFHYGPMYGAQIAFRDFIPTKGIWGSEWIGLENFPIFLTAFNSRGWCATHWPSICWM